MGGTYNVLNAAYAGGADPTGTNDSTDAINAALAAAPAGQPTWFPPGTYAIAGQVTPVANQAGGLIAVAPSAVTLAFDTSDAAIAFGANTGSQRFTLRGIQLEQNGTGDLIAIGSSSGNRLPQITAYDTWFTLGSANTGGSWINSQGPASSNSIANSHFLRCSFNSNSTTRTVPGLNLTCQVAGGMSNCSWEKCDFNPSDNDEYCVYLSASSGGTDNAYHCNMAFRDCRFEHPLGGAIQSMSGRNLIIENIAIWDIAILGGLALEADIIYIGSNSGQYVSAANKIDGYMRYIGSAGNGPSASGPYDIYVDANSVQTEIRSAVGISTFHTTATPIYFNFNSCPTATIGNAQTPLATDSTSYSITNPPARLNSADAGIIALENAATAPSGSPSGGGILYGAGASRTISARTGSCATLPSRPAGCRKTRVTWSGITTRRRSWAAARPTPRDGPGHPHRGPGHPVGHQRGPRAHHRRDGLTADECYAGLYTSTGAQIGITADQSANWAANGDSYHAMALASGPFTVQPGFVFVLFVCNESGGGVAQFGKAQNFATAIANPGTNSGAACRWGTGAAGQSGLPGSFTPSSYLSASQATWWAALS